MRILERNWSKWVILPIIVVMFLGSACVVSPPPPPPPEPDNQAPNIHYITAEKQVVISTSSQVICIATDADNDALSYWWSADGGMIEGDGEEVTWIAPGVAGDYAITVMVTDGKDDEASDSIIITVISAPNEAPVITAFNITPKKQPQITISPNGEDQTWVRRYSTTEIECVAEDQDGDELTYIWSATSGKVVGEGPIIRWTAWEPGNPAVTATVTDGKSGEVTASAYFEVPCCGG